MYFAVDNNGTVYCFLEDYGITLTFNKFSNNWELSSQMFALVDGPKGLTEISEGMANKLTGGVSVEKALNDIMDILA